MKNFKWGITSFNEKPIYVVLFVSRNKDNKDIPNFVERRESFITHETYDSKSLESKFNHFVNEGVSGELCRMYISVNERNGKTIYKKLLHFLIDNPEFNLCSIQSKLAGIAAEKDCALSKKWLFDFDKNDFDSVKQFVYDISKSISEPIKVEIHHTPHGYGIITERGFDCRSILEKYPFVTLKRDDLLCTKWVKTE